MQKHFIPPQKTDILTDRQTIPESLICLRASLSEKEDISVGSFLTSKPLKETLRVYTTSSDSSALSFETRG